MVYLSYSQEQVKTIGAVSKGTHPWLGEVLMAEPPLKFGGKSQKIEGPCPRLGQHTREVSLAAGLTEVEIASLFEAGVLAK